MCANEWGDMKYTRVPSVCMKRNKKHFEKHDKGRYEQYLEDVKAGKKTVASGALKPHEIVREAMQHTGCVTVCAECHMAHDFFAPKGQSTKSVHNTDQLQFLHVMHATCWPSWAN